MVRNSISTSYIKFLDYAAIGLPIICSNIEPYRMIARNGENSMIVDNNTKDWHQALKQMIDDKNLRNRLSENAFLDLKNNYCLIPCISNKEKIMFLCRTIMRV